MNYMKMLDLYFGFYHYMKRKIIQRSDRRICKNRLTGTRLLTKEQKKKIKEFYSPYCNVTTMFHQLYYEKTGLFSEKYLPVDMYTNHVDEYYNARMEAKFLDNKCYYRAIFNGLKQPEFAVCRCGGLWYDENMQLINREKALEIVAKETELFVKVATESYGGKGVEYIDFREEDGLDKFVKFEQFSKNDIIAQRAIKQHKDIAAVNDSSVNTIRMVSLLTENGPKIYSSIFRVGVKGKKVG